MNLTKFLRTSAAALGALAVASAANAADIYSGGYKEAPAYIPPPFWTGFYIGGHIGAAWESLSSKNFEFNDGGSNYVKNYQTYYYNPAFLHEQQQSNGDAFGGVQLGYNWQLSSPLVVGLEVDLGGMSLNGHGRASGNTFYTNSSGSVVGIGTPVLFNEDNQGGFYGDVTGRLGYTWGPAMLYVKGGFAWLNTDLAANEGIFQGTSTMCGSPGWCDFSHSTNTTLTGWTLGGGVEWKVSPAWSIKAEYLHFQFDNFNNNCCNDWYSQQGWGWSNNFDHHATLDIDTVKLGFNYFWNPAPPAPLK